MQKKKKFKALLNDAVALMWVESKPWSKAEETIKASFWAIFPGRKAFLMHPLSL